MKGKGHSDSVAAALASGVSGHDIHASPKPGSDPMFTICMSREAGSNALAVATEIGKRLDWPVYDKELLDIIAKEIGVRSSQLELLDEKPMTWLEQAFVDFLTDTSLNHETYIIHLVALIRSLGSRGHCIIVGRGASFVLPSHNTLRVKLVADIKERVAMVKQVHGLNEKDALKWIEQTTKERHEFVQNHLHKDTNDAHLMDLVINLSQFSIPQVADLIMDALKMKQIFVAQHTSSS